MIRSKPQRLNDLAVTYRAKPTAVDHALEYVAHGREVDELAFDFSVMSAGDVIDSLAGLIAVGGECEQITHDIEAELQVAGTILLRTSPIKAIVANPAPARNVELAPSLSQRRPARRLATSIATPAARLNTPNAEPLSSGGARSATSFAIRPWVSAM